MTFLDSTRSNRSGPQRASPAPRRRDPAQPQPGESFADYYRRQPGMSPIADAGRGAATVQRSETNRAGRGGEARRDSIRFGLRHAIGRAMLEENNNPTARLLDIPMGQHLIRKDGRELSPGNEPAAGYSIENGRIGLIRWNTDMRRSLGDVFSDIERVSGAPEGFLTRLANKESAGDVEATPGTSSATGFFQVIDGTWNSWADNPRFQQTYGIAMDRDELAQYRGDARVDGAIAAEIARTNADWLRRNGVEPTERHLYLGHFGGENGLLMARDQARGGFKHRYGFEYFTERERNANAPVFWEPQRDANNRVMYRTVERNGRRVRVQIPNYSRPRTSEQVWEHLTGRFPDTPVSFGQRADGTDELLTQ